MNEQERRVNRGLRALDEAHRTGRIGRQDYRARRRALLQGLNDADGETERNAIVPRAPAAPPRSAQREALPAGSIAGALFPDRRRRLLHTWLLVLAGLGLALLLIYGVLQLGQG